MPKKMCEKCGSTMETTNFYSSNNKERFPDGKVNKCKKCWTMHVDCWNKETFFPLLEEADVPFVEEEWKKEVDKAVNSGKKISGMTVIGKYLSRMRLSQYRDSRWKDTGAIAEKAALRLKMALESDTITDQEKEDLKARSQAMPTKPADFKTGAEEMLEAQRLAEEEREEREEKEAEAAKKASKSTSVVSGPAEPVTMLSQEDLQVLKDLTKEDIDYLNLQWRGYRPSQQVYLEKLYQDYLNSYDIQTAGHRDTLRFVCITSLQMNELLGMGDIDGASKASRMYDSLMKSGKFTAAQNKAEKGEAVDSVAEFALLCEKEGGFIPKFYQDIPNDAVDKCLEDNKRYIKNLVVNEQGLGSLLEQAIKEMQIEAQRELSADSDDNLIELDESEILGEVEFNEFNNFVEEEKEIDLNGSE